MAVLSSQTVHACFAVAFRTQASTRFVTGELDNNIPMKKNRSFVITYLASMTTGATIGLTRILEKFFFSVNDIFKRAALNGGSNERGCG